MKNLLIVVFTFAFFVNTEAQVEKGSFMVGGSMSLRRNALSFKDKSLSAHPTASFEVSPTVGYFLIKRLMLGAEVSLNRQWTLNDENVRSLSYGVGPLVRYYFPLGKFAFFPEVGYSFNRQKGHDYLTVSDFSMTPYSYNYTYNRYHVAIGATWFATPNVGIEGKFLYSLTDYGSQTTGSGLILQFGIQFYIPKKVN